MGIDKGNTGIWAMNANSYRAQVVRKRILELVAENYIISASLVSHTLLLSYATVLRHLRVLEEEKLVILEKQGRTLVAKYRQNVKEIQEMNTKYEGYLNVGKEITKEHHEYGKAQEEDKKRRRN